MVSQRVTVSVAIATYEMSGRGRYFLRQALQSISNQDFLDIEVVVYDDSIDSEIQIECDAWSNKIPVRYFRNDGPRISPSAKFNLAIDKCQGTIVKLLCQDDTLGPVTSISQTVHGLSNGHVWLVSAYAHIDDKNVKLSSHVPKMNPRIERVNTIGSQSGLAFLNKKQDLRFSESLFWRMDCEFYRRLFEKFGEPFVLLSETVCVRQWSGQSTKTIIQRRDRVMEFVNVLKKYPRKIRMPE